MLDSGDYKILIYLLKKHIESGDYFKNKDNHYKRCKLLLKKLQNYEPDNLKK